MQGFTVTAITNAEKTKTSTLMSNFDVNVDGWMVGRKDRRMNGRTEIWTPISHPAISRCDKNWSSDVQTQSDTNRPVQSQKKARSLTFWI